MTIGAGAHIEAVGTTVLVLVVLIPLRTLDRWSAGLRARNGDEEIPPEDGLDMP
jgi:uncharacterized membrane protein YhiD involved in acid resistance